MPQFQQNCLLTGCSDADIKECSAKASKRVDPLLKLYVGRPVMINQNIDVDTSMANGTMCTFKSLKLKKGYEDCEVINIDGFYVRCIEANKVEYIEVVLQEGETRKVLKLEATKTTATARFPCPTGFDTTITHKTSRMSKNIQLLQFPLKIANARTVHKLQGRSLENLLVSTWSYTLNWIYVVLSRVRTSKGLYVRTPLFHSKTISSEYVKDGGLNKEFHSYCRATKVPA